MTVPAGSVTSLLPKRLEELCGALESEPSSDADGLLEQALENDNAISNEATIAKRRFTITSCKGKSNRTPAGRSLEGADGVRPNMALGNRKQV